MSDRTLLTRAAWADLAAQPLPGLIGLWADTVQVHALLDGPTLVSVAVEHGGYAALSPRRPTAALFERLVHDLWGHNAVGGHGRPWLNHGAWPLQHPMSLRPTPGSAPGAPIDDEPSETGAGLSVLRRGPVRGGAGLHEPSVVRVVAAGERVIEAEPRLGYAHKGTLLLMRGKSPRAAGRLVARIRGDATVAHSVAFARAAEDASGVTPPPRGAALREAMGALEAVAVHLGEAARMCAACGCPNRYGLQRDAVLRAIAVAFGHRLMFDCVAPGGAAADLAPGGAAGLLAALAEPAAPPPGLGTRLGHRADAFAHRLDLVRDAAGRVRTRLADLPGGPAIIPLPAASGEGLGHADSAHGDVWHWLRLDGGAIANAFAIDPAWRAWPAFATAATGRILSELPSVEASFGLSASGVDL